MTDTAADVDDIVLDYDLDEAPEKVWRALIRPELVAEWLGPNDIEPEIGRKFALEPTPDKPVECEVIEADLERKLSYRWREADERGGLVDSVVTFEVTPTPLGGSHLRLVHSGFHSAGAGSLVSAANDNGRLWGTPSPFDRLRVRTTEATIEILTLSLSKHKGISGPRSAPQHVIQWRLQWAA